MVFSEKGRMKRLGGRKGGKVGKREIALIGGCKGGGEEEGVWERK